MTNATRRWVLAALLVLPLALGAQEAPPSLSEMERLKIQVNVQRLEIAQLKAQAAQAEFDKAREDFNRLVLSLQKDGYTLDLEKFIYTKKEPTK